MKHLLTLFLLYSPIALLAHSIEYKLHPYSNPKRTVHHFKVNPRKHAIELVNGSDSCVGMETLSSMASRRGALLAVNGGYFQGVPMLGAPDGPFKIGGQIAGSRVGETGAIGWSRGGRKAAIDRVIIKPYLISQGRILQIDGINRKLYPKNAVVYTGNFNHTTMSPSGTKEYVIENGIMTILLDKPGNRSIPRNGYIYSVGKECRQLIPTYLNRKPVQLQAQLIPVLKPEKKSSWQTFDNIVNGIIILSGGNRVTDYHKERMSRDITHHRHARTAVGIDRGHHWHFVVVEAHHQGNTGMTMDELGHFMKGIGCVDAIALDGGGSSTVYYQGKTSQYSGHKEHSFMQHNVYYHPDGGERPIGNAIIVKATKR